MTAIKKPAVAKPHTAPRKKAIKKPVAKHDKPVADEAVEQAPAKERKVSDKTYYAVGKRKTAVAQILLTNGNGTITVNQLPFEKYFGTEDLQFAVNSPLNAIGLDKKISLKAKVHGGGIHAQAEALRHAIARALIQLDPESRRTLKKLGFLTRDPRVKERKKPGLKRARRAPQFSKR